MYDGYLMAVADMMRLAVPISNSAFSQSCLPKEVGPDDLRSAFLERYRASNEKLKDESAAAMVRAAIYENWRICARIQTVK